MNRLLPIVIRLLLAGCARTGETPPKEPDPPQAEDPVLEQISAEDWQTLTAAENRGMLLRFVGAEGQSLAFCEGGDVVELFCLTEGRTHDWFVPCKILDRSAEELADLPALLDQLAEAEGRELCAALGRCLRETDGWDHSVETLKPLLGGYGDWLDA